MKILVVGLGLMGGAYALRLKNKNHIVYGTDINEDIIKFAKDNNYIDDGSLEPKDFISKVDLIIIALYPKLIIEFLNKYSKYFNENQVITDIAGVKSCFVPKAEECAKPASYISHHPMAGKEICGIKGSHLVQFKDANFLITTTDNTNINKIDVIKKIGQDLEFGKITVMDIESHDKFIGFTSQLTHAIAVSLMNCDISEATFSSVGDSFRDLTRIAKINENLWPELFLSNKDNLINEIDSFIDSINNIKNALINDDKEALKELFRHSTMLRKEMDKK